MATFPARVKTIKFEKNDFLGWRDKMQKYPDEPAMDNAYRIYNPLARKANRKHGPPAPPKFKVSFEKWLRFLVEDTKDKHMNNHWKPQDQICHFVSS